MDNRTTNLKTATITIKKRTKKQAAKFISDIISFDFMSEQLDGTFRYYQGNSILTGTEVAVYDPKTKKLSVHLN